jgi:hypothetical protein
MAGGQRRSRQPLVALSGHCWQQGSKAVGVAGLESMNWVHFGDGQVCHMISIFLYTCICLFPLDQISALRIRCILPQRIPHYAVVEGCIKRGLCGKPGGPANQDSGSRALALPQY